MWIEIISVTLANLITFVTPLAGVWIEIGESEQQHPRYPVTPLAGVWIEIAKCTNVRKNWKVTPLAGVWIEIFGISSPAARNISVTPLAGVWIEILKMGIKNTVCLSLPSRECGLKFCCTDERNTIFGHSPRGSVD